MSHGLSHDSHGRLACQRDEKKETKEVVSFVILCLLCLVFLSLFTFIAPSLSVVTAQVFQ
jgi:hypothetical protein